MAEVDVAALRRLRDEHDREPDAIRQLHLYDQINAFAWDQWPSILAALERAERVKKAALAHLEAEKAWLEAAEHIVPDADAGKRWTETEDALRAALEATDG